jgi:leucine efflux protein
VFGIQEYRSFIAAIILFQVMPGAGTMIILDATAREGIGPGMGSVLGTLLGDTLFMVAAVAGLAAAMQATPLLFSGLQWFGAAYLCWLGFKLLRDRDGGGEDLDRPRKSGFGFRFRQALLVDLTNPKVSLFFLAFFPLFLRPESPRSTLVAMMVHVTVVSTLYQVGLVLLGNAAALRLRHWPWARRTAARLAGVALIGFGVKLAVRNS